MTAEHAHYETSDAVAKAIQQLAELLEVRQIVAIIATNTHGGLRVIGPTVAEDELDAISEGIRKELLARGLAKP